MKTTENKGFLTSPNAMGRSVAVKLPVAFQKANKINGFEHIFYGTALNFFRYQFRWETLQAKPKVPLDKGDLERFEKTVQMATSKKLVVLLDPHNYARYGTNIIGGPKISTGDYADFWGRLATQFKDNPYVWFGLVNEPHDMPTQQWFDAANAAIVAIRATGAKT